MSDLSTIEVKVVCKFPNLSSYTIPMVSRNKALNRFETLCEDGQVVLRALNAEDEKKGLLAAKLTLSKQEKVMVPDRVNPQIMVPVTRCYTIISYLPEEKEIELKDPEEQIKNRKIRVMHSFIVSHSNAEVLNVKGENINKNLQTPLFTVIDETNTTRAKKHQNELVTKCRTLAESLYKVDEKGFIDLCYSLNIPNIHLSNPDTLFNKMNEIIQTNPVFFDETYNSRNRAIMAMINRAIYQPLSNGTTAIEFKAGYYQLDNLALTKNKEELLDYFIANPESLKRLEQLMGAYIPRPELKRLEDPKPVEPLNKENTKPAAEVVAKQNELKQKIYNMLYTMRRKGGLQNEDWEEYMGKLKVLKESNPEMESYIDLTSENLCNAAKLENPFKKALIDS